MQVEYAWSSYDEFKSKSTYSNTQLQNNHEFSGIFFVMVD